MLPALQRAAPSAARRLAPCRAWIAGATGDRQQAVAAYPGDAAPAIAPLDQAASDAPRLDFANPQQAFAAKSTGELVRQLLVLRACQLRPLVDHADTLLQAAEKLLGKRLTYGVVRRTFYAHFVAGEDGDSIQPVLARLHDNGIGGILDYAAEDDVATEGPAASRVEPHDSVVARTYEYEGERQCDEHMRVFEKAIDAAAQQAGEGFAAIKMTALGKPSLLERVSASLNALRQLFEDFDVDRGGWISMEEFREVYTRLFTDASDERLAELYGYLDYEHRGQVDYVAWSKQVRVQDAPLIAARCRTRGAFASTVLSGQELTLLENMMRRLDRLAERAARSGVRLMVDAEHSYFQPAIDHAATEMARKYNVTRPVVFNTYQCYLRGSTDRVREDMDRARREGFKFGAKLVRGAYMHLERARAAERGYESPIWDTAQETHDNYDRVVDDALEAVCTHGAEVMLATHNQGSIERAVGRMAALGLPPRSSGVFFGQLLGMADHLSYTLGMHGYKAYKYVPFGPVELVMPYLIRRAQENAGLLGGVGHELRLVQHELRRRLSGGLLG